MTEAEWLASTDPQRMLAWITGQPVFPGVMLLRPRASDRKLRLFACACCWGSSSSLGMDAEQFMEWQSGPAKNAANWAMAWAGNQQEPPVVARTNLLRDIFGNPFRPVTLPKVVSATRYEWSPWITCNVAAIAKGIYAERAFERMPILGDALEDAGCDNADILDHCRATVGRTEAEVRAEGSTVVGCCNRHADNMGCDCLHQARGNIGPHVRGCWVLDLILGRE